MNQKFVESKIDESLNVKKTAENQINNSVTLQKTFYDSYFHQNFSFRYSLIDYISKNPSSSKVYQKLIQACKHFFIKNPILVISELNTLFRDKKWHSNFKKIKSKLWITEKICVSYSDDDDEGSSKNDRYFLEKSVIPKIYQSDIKYLRISNQIISLKNFILITSKCENVHFNEVDIINDGSSVTLQKIAQVLPNLKNGFGFLSKNMITKNTFKELTKIPHFLNLSFFDINNATEAYDINDIYFYIKKNQKTKFRIIFSFSAVPSEEYKSRLQAIVDEIVQTENHNYKPPLVTFEGIQQDSYEKLKRLHDPN